MRAERAYGIDAVETFSVAGTDDVIMVIRVLGAKREQKPVYILEMSMIL